MRSLLFGFVVVALVGATPVRAAVLRGSRVVLSWRSMRGDDVVRVDVVRVDVVRVDVVRVDVVRRVCFADDRRFPVRVLRPGTSGVGSFYVAPGPMIQSSPWSATRSRGVVRWKSRSGW